MVVIWPIQLHGLIQRPPPTMVLARAPWPLPAEEGLVPSNKGSPIRLHFSPISLYHTLLTAGTAVGWVWAVATGRDQ